MSDAEISECAKRLQENLGYTAPELHSLVIERHMGELADEVLLTERQACAEACKQVRAASCSSAIAASAANECVKAIEARKD